MFAAEIQPAKLDHRRTPVPPDAVPGGNGLERALCRVMDVSLHDVRLQTYSALKNGATVWLTLAGLGRRAGVIVWADDFAARCRFREPLTEAEVEGLGLALN